MQLNDMLYVIHGYMIFSLSSTATCLYHSDACCQSTKLGTLSAANHTQSFIRLPCNIEASGSQLCYHAYSLEHNLQYRINNNYFLGAHVYSRTHWLGHCNFPPPLPHIWAHIRGRYWPAKIDNISLLPPIVSIGK